MKTRLLAAAISAALLTGGFAVVPSAVRANPADGPTNNGAGVDSSRAIVQLVGDPLTTSSKTKPAPGKKIDWAGTNVRSYRAELSARRNDFKRWLQSTAPKAKVTGEFDTSLNAVAVELNGTALTTLRTSPLAVRVEFENVYAPTADVSIPDPDLAIIHAVDAWGTAGSASAGNGIKVGVVDTGIDVRHPCFSDAGYPAQTQLGDPRFTNNKVIVAKVFNNKTPSRAYTAEAIGDHGTHVSGTIACNFQTSATVNGAPIPYGMSGVAPRALLGNYNVFPSDVSNARSEDILNALDAAVGDGMDVINMSLGGGSHGIQDLLTVAVDNIDQANIVVAVSAGNEGPGHDTVGSPGMAARALTSGASTVPHFVGATLVAGTASYDIASGDFGVVAPAGLSATMAVVLNASGGLSIACTPLAAGSLTGKIAIISRGSCSFSTKIRGAQAAGAAAAILVNNVAGDPTAMGQDGTASQPTIPAYMVSVSAKAALIGTNGSAGSISAALAYKLTANADIMAGFSSQGPTDVDRRVKPDVVAPGVNVLSSIPVSFCGGAPCFAFFSGTSMSSPHLAGSAAVVRQQHPDWSAAKVRSAIVNTADEGVLKAFNTGSLFAPPADPNVVGAGRENLLSAVGAKVLLDPVSVSFGRIPSGSGQTRSATIAITNTSSVPVVVAVDGDAAKFASGTATIAAGATANVIVTGAAAKGQPVGMYSATLRITGAGGVAAHAVLFYEVG